MTTNTATWNGQTYTRNSNRTYTHAAVVRWSTGEEAVVSWHSTEYAARKGTLTGQQKKNGATVIAVVPVTTEAVAKSTKQVPASAEYLPEISNQLGWLLTR